MKKVIAERNIVVMLFILVLITFSFAQRDSKRLEQLYISADKTKASLTLPKTIKLPNTLEVK